MADTVPASSRRRPPPCFSLPDSHEPPAETQRVSVPLPPPHAAAAFTPTLKSPLARFHRSKTTPQKSPLPVAPSRCCDVLLVSPSFTSSNTSLSNTSLSNTSLSNSSLSNTCSENPSSTCTHPPTSTTHVLGANIGSDVLTINSADSTETVTDTSASAMNATGSGMAPLHRDRERHRPPTGTSTTRTLSGAGRVVRKLLMNMLAEALDACNERAIATASINYPPKAPALQNPAPATTPTNPTSLASATSSASSSTSTSGSFLSSQTAQTSVFISPVRSFSFHDDIPSNNVNYSPKHSQQPANFSRNTKNLSLNIVHDHHQQHKHHLSHFQQLGISQSSSDDPQPIASGQSPYPRRSLSLLIPDQPEQNPERVSVSQNQSVSVANSGANSTHKPANPADPVSDSSGNQTLTTTTTITTTTTSDGLTTTVATTMSKINESKFGKSSVNSDDNTSISDSTNSIFDTQPQQADDLDMHEDGFSNDVVPQFSRMLLMLGKSKFGFPEEMQESSQLDAYPQGPRSVLNDLIFLYGDPQQSKVPVDINKFDLVINVARECRNLLDQFDTVNNTKEYLFVPWSHTSLILKELPMLTQKISEYQAKGLKILVHCQCGVSRSACVIVAYFMRQFLLLVNEAYELLKSGSDSDTGKSDKLQHYHINACERICPNMSLIFELMDFNEVLQGTTPTGE